MLPTTRDDDGKAWSPVINDLVALKNQKQTEKIIKSNVPMNRFALPEEIADSALFLCSERAKFITGATLVIDGGQTVGIT